MESEVWSVESGEFAERSVKVCMVNGHPGAM